MPYRLALILTLACVVGCASEVGVGSASEALILTGECDVRGAGMHTSQNATFTGHVTGSADNVEGRWLHTIPGEAIILGHPNEILCRINGRTIADFRGDADVNGDNGYFYAVNVEDAGNVGLTSYEVTELRTLTASRYSPPTVWVDDRWEGRATFEVPSEIPVTVGSSGRGHAYLTFQRADSLDTVSCHYKGHGTSGDRYRLHRCRSEWRGETPVECAPVEAGSLVDTLWAELHVQNGANGCGPGGSNDITVELTIEVTTTVETEPDFVRITVFDAAGDRVHLAEGDLTLGNVRITELD